MEAVLRPALDRMLGGKGSSAQVGKFLQGIGAAWNSLALDVESVDEAGGNVVGVARGYALVHLFEIRNGRICRFREYVNKLS